jgi:hypothetical protein
VNPKKRSPHRANGEGKTNNAGRRLVLGAAGVKSSDAALDFLQQTTFARFTRAFLHFSPDDRHSQNLNSNQLMQEKKTGMTAGLTTAVDNVIAPQENRSQP